MKLPAPNRIAVYLTGLAGLSTALAPVVGDMDASSTAGLVVGFLGVVGVVDRFLKGWQAHEARFQAEAARRPVD